MKLKTASLPYRDVLKVNKTTKINKAQSEDIHKILATNIILIYDESM